jgi:hypothetical protein
MPRRPVREFLSRLPLVGRLFRRFRTVTLYGETLCPNDFHIYCRAHTCPSAPPTIIARDPADAAQAARLQPCIEAEWADMTRRMYESIPVRDIPLWHALQ